MDPIGHVYTDGMSKTDVEHRLRTERAGVLSLAEENRAYAIPVSQLYDGESIYFRLGDDGTSRKIAAITATEEACFVLFDGTDEDESWSIVVNGPIRRIPESAVPGAENRPLHELFGPIRVFDEAIEDIDIGCYELEITTVVGRMTSSSRAYRS